MLDSKGRIRRPAADARLLGQRFSTDALVGVIRQIGERFEIIWNDDSSASANRHILNIPATDLEASQSSLATSHARFRSVMGQISRHSAVFFAGTLFTTGPGYLFKIYLARVLGSDALGMYTFRMTIVGFFGLFNGLGLPQGVRAAMGLVPEAGPGNSRFEIINLGSSRPVMLAELVDLLEKVTGRKAIRQYLPQQPGDVPVTWPDLTKARRLLSHRPVFPIAKGLENFVSWFRRERALTSR
jgi:hypothetical protein